MNEDPADVFPPDGTDWPDEDRCEAISPDDFRCALRRGHTGSHWAL